ncbi:MAG: nuclear transport factor 2 family protein [Proteobacteria bacterium]|nr:nuclear transport factor 2 family protein [Pseudomonadota bacterium]
MRTQWTASLGGLALLLAAALIQAAAPANTPQEIVAGLEQTWMKAQQTNNYDALEPLLADTIVVIGSDGKVSHGKAAALTDAKTVKWTNVDYSEMKFSVYGDTVVATGSFRGKGTDSTGAAVDERSHFTDTWVKMPDGKWQCVASQDTAYKKH